MAQPDRPPPSQPCGPGASLSGDAGEGDAARETLLVYRHRLVPPSEAGFLGRFYVGFERLHPVWVGCHFDAARHELPGETLRLGRPGPLGALDRALFRHVGVLPPAPELRGRRPSVVHALFGRGGALALPIARALGVPLVVTFLGGDATKETHYRRRLLPHVYGRRLAALQREAALFVCVSEFIRDRLLARGFPPEKLEVIYQGVPLDEAPPDTLPSPEPYILFVGRFVEKKGATHLIEAMRALHSRGAGARLVLIGDGPLGGELKIQARGMHGVAFPGWLPQAEVRQWMRGAAALCVPSVTARDGDAEGLPNVVVEAMAAGVPVVGTRHAGIAEAIEHGRTGLLVPERDPLALAEALEHLVAQPALRARLGAAARNVAAARFSAITQSRRLEAALLRAAGKAPR